MAGGEIRLNAFTMNCVGHQAPGLWTHPRDRSTEYKRLPYWIELARLLEAGLFDGVFFADVLGAYDVYGGGPDAALRSAVQVPVNDPLLVIPAMAAVTEHLGFGVTVNLSYEPVMPLARRFSTLDHLTDGRVGWNVVTGYLDSAARAAGRPKQAAHDDRYDAAEPIMQAAYRLWEASWADDAVVADRTAGVYARPDRVRAVQQLDPALHAIHLAEPSPQRTPVIYQAGSSPRGRAFGRAPCRMRVRLRPERERGGAAGGRHPGAGGGRGTPHRGIHPAHGHRCRDGRRGAGAARRLPPLRQSMKARWR